MPGESIKSQLASIPEAPGIYQFFDEKNQILYVGKAKNLRKRVASYSKQNQASARIARLVLLTQKVEFTQTSNEVEALFLEHNLIKKLLPRFNILLRDDKTFPQILITAHPFPRITKYRGQKNSDKNSLGKHFGPFISAGDVDHSIDILRKIFRLRNCSDSEFKSRRKPCLEFQIKRCSAPCVGLVSQEEYKISVDGGIAFLSGKSAQVQKKLKAEMREASAGGNYEKAASIRDQIESLNALQTKQQK